MKVTLVGGMDRLEPHYRREAQRAGHDLKIFFQYETGMASKLGATEAIVVFTGQVSHGARNLAIETARHLGIPVVQSHSSGVSSFKDCLAGL